MKDWILTKDNVFSEQECDELINLYKPLAKFDEKDMIYYSFLDIEPDKFKYDYKINYLIKEYAEQYPEINKTASVWTMTAMRFKHFRIFIKCCLV